MPTYFCDRVLGYELAGFFARNSDKLKQTVEQVLQTLLTPGEPPEMADKPVTTDEIELTDELEAAEDLELNTESDDEY